MSPAVPGCVAADHPLSRLTTVGTGGAARWFARPRTQGELEEVLDWASQLQLELAVVGLGSNLLAADQGYDGLVVRLAGELAGIERRGDLVACGGGASLAAVVRRCQEWGLSGIEFGCAIPGTAGGAVRMNAGAHGGDMAGVLAEALVTGPQVARRVAPDGLEMGYRRSNVGPAEVVSEVVLRLRPQPPEQIRRTVAEMRRHRRETQPAKVRTFGSVWKNPAGDHSAGGLLEQCGMKGFAVGGARISPVHANFVENTGTATSADVLAVMVAARRRAWEQFGVLLEHEVQFLGPIGLPPPPV